MNLQQRIDLLSRLGKYILSGNESWQQAIEKASGENSWFIPPFINHAAAGIARSFLQKDILEQWTADLNKQTPTAHTIGIIMAGNIPLVGFHDLLSVFISGHKALVKTSAKDTTLVTHLVNTLALWDQGISQHILFADRLNGCDAYIATGSNNSAGYFDYYFGKYPHIIRRNRTSVAVLTGKETVEELEGLSQDVYLYFGRGCRNVTKLYVPEGYDFIPLLSVFKKYDWLADHNKYKNNYDYNLAIHILNRQLYMSNESILLVENPSLFSPVSQLNYEFYTDPGAILPTLKTNQNIQCIAGKGFLAFGTTQNPGITDYADGVDTLAFLRQIS